MKNIVILGSTGSIGINTLKVIKAFPDRFKVIGLSANENVDLLMEQIKYFKPQTVAVMNPEKAKILKSKISNKHLKIYNNLDGLIKLATLPQANLIVVALVGSVGLLPTLEAIKNNKDIALANKETLVMAGKIIMSEAKKHKVNIIPIDSEHSAILQCLKTEKLDKVKKIILTASGGPFYKKSMKNLKKVTLNATLKHPTWNMGKKITIDSATLMNKGFEVIEAHYLFGLPMEKIEVIIHPESIVHSMVEYVDGSILAQLSKTDMKIPIQYALTYPERLNSNLDKYFNLADIKNLTFIKPDFKKFLCLEYSYTAGNIGGTMPAVLNAANEIAVRAFLHKKIKFLDIPRIIKKVMDKHKFVVNPSLDKIIEADKWARIEADKDIVL
ncbi:MAG: 1-deoxy-D-xylulose-5-phosphate reductoisomerase [Candidatus Firestonebacteria bacterium]